MLRDYLGTVGFIMVVQMALAEILLASGIIAYAFSILIFSLAATVFGLRTSPKPRGVLIMMPSVVFLLSITLSFGFLEKYAHIPAVLIAGSSQTAALSLLIGEFGTAVSSIYILGIAHSTKLEEAGYELDEINGAMNGIVKTVFTLALFSLVITVVILFAAGEVPFFNIGLLPAILLFGTFYIIIFRFLIKQERHEKKG